MQFSYGSRRPSSPCGSSSVSRKTLESGFLCSFLLSVQAVLVGIYLSAFYVRHASGACCTRLRRTCALYRAHLLSPFFISFFFFLGGGGGGGAGRWCLGSFLIEPNRERPKDTLSLQASFLSPVKKKKIHRACVVLREVDPDYR